jgi:hypothetical protein
MIYFQQRRQIMSFNPLKEKGIPLDNQLRNWTELNIKPYDKNLEEPYSKCRVITLNGIEIEGAMFSHQFARHTPELELKRKLALVRRIEQQQQKAISWLTPGEETTLEVTIGYEQVAVDLTAWLARSEPDPYLKQAYEFGLLEDFDHLYRYANLYDMLEGKKAEKLTKSLTEITPGRPTVVEHRHPYDDVRKPYNKNNANILSKLHVLTLVAAEQQTMNFYMTIGNRNMEPLARGLYLEIGMIEEQHVTHYESLMDASASWFEQLILHEYNECYLYHSFMIQETDPRLKQLWELHLNMEIEHLRVACDLMKQYEKRDPADFLPAKLPEPVLFQPNKQYVRKVLAEQINLTANRTEFVPIEQLPKDHSYYQYQKAVNSEDIPSQEVISKYISKKGKDYRDETEGEHPVLELQQKKQKQLIK